MTPFEFVLIFLMGGVIILSIASNDRSETNSIAAVMTVALLHRLVSSLSARFRLFGAIFEGVPLVLFEKGRRRTEIMRRMRIQDTDVMAAARARSVKTLRQIRYAVLERVGSISILKRDE